MELVSGMSSFVMSVLDTEAELKRMLEKMDVLITKAEKLLLQANFDDIADKKEIQLYQNILRRSKEAHGHCENTLKGLGIAGKITINLPFSRTKQMLRESMEELESMVADLKDMGEPQPIKRKPTDEDKKMTVSTAQNSREVEFDPTLRHEEPEQMGPTIEDKEDNHKGTWIRVKLTFQAEPTIQKRIQQEMPEIAFVDENFQFKENETQRMIISFNRLIFKPYYSTVKSLIPEIDFISSKEKHMDIICKRQKRDKFVENTLISVVKELSAKKEVSKKQSQGKDSQHQNDVFFSFPINNILEANNSEDDYYYTLVCKNYSKIGTYLLKNNDPMKKIENEQIILGSGDRICPILKRPQRTNPAFSYVVHFEHITYLD